jgi:Large polyvalent protein-associated domain 3
MDKILSFSSHGIPTNDTERKIYLNEHYRTHTKNKSVVNTQTGIEIFFNSDGRKKTAKRHNNLHTSVVIKNVFTILKHAQYNNFGKPKPKHIINFPSILMFINFKIKVRIDGVIRNFRISCMILKGNKVQYDLHESSLDYAITTGKKKV